MQFTIITDSHKPSLEQLCLWFTNFPQIQTEPVYDIFFLSFLQSVYVKNFMEDKQLDFNQPLLSVRRYSSNVTKADSDRQRETGTSVRQLPPLPVYRSELKSGPVRNPGTIPFIWEKSPGRPKDEDKSRCSAAKGHLVAPKLPPGRTPNAGLQLADKASERIRVAPRSDPVLSSSQNILLLNKNEIKHDTANDEKEEIRSSDSEDSNEAYEDALDTLSRSESFFLNCSISGVSGLNDPESKPSGIFSADPQTRDLMMGRFLPAAKAMASETPPHCARKQALVQERPQHERKVANDIHPDHSFNPNRYAHHPQGYGLEESEDEDHCNGSENLSAKACGLFPQFLLKGSFCLLNLAPAMKMQAHKPVSSVHRVQAKPYLGSCNGIENQGTMGAPYEKGSICGHQAEKLRKNMNDVKAKPSQISFLGGGQAHNRHMYGHSQSRNRPAYPSKSSCSIPQGKGFLETQIVTRDSRVNDSEPVKKHGQNFQDQLISEGEGESHSGSPMVEKTLYVDAVHKVKSPESKCSDIGENDLVTHLELKKTNEISLVGYSTQDIKLFESEVEKSGLHSRSAESIDSSSVIDPDKSFHEEMDETNYSRRDKHLIDESTVLLSLKKIDMREQTGQIVNKVHKAQMERSDQGTSEALIPAPLTSTRSKVAEHRKTKLENRLNIRTTKDESNYYYHLQFPLPLPVPKSPSESWLKRTLPTVATRNLSSPSPMGLPNSLETLGAKPSGDSKWETIVRTSNLQHGHLWFSEELLTPIPEVE